MEMQPLRAGIAGSFGLLKNIYVQGARDEQEPTRQRQEVRSYGTPLAYAMVRVGWENPIHGLAWKLPEAASQVKCLPQGSLGWMSDYLE